MPLRRKGRKGRKQTYKQRSKNMNQTTAKSTSGDKRKRKRQEDEGSSRDPEPSTAGVGSSGASTSQVTQESEESVGGKKRKMEDSCCTFSENPAPAVNQEYLSPLLETIKTEPIEQEEYEGNINLADMEGTLTSQIEIKDPFEIKEEFLDFDLQGIYPNSPSKSLTSIASPRDARLCLVEHNYFASVPDESGSEFGTTTVPLTNTVEAVENRTEQQTVELHDLITKHVDTAPAASTKTDLGDYSETVRAQGRKSTASKVRRREGRRKSTSGRALLRARNTGNSPSSDGSRSAGVEIAEKDDPSMTRPASDLGNTSQIDDGSRGSSTRVDQLEVVSLDEIDKEITEMERLLQSNCEILCEKKGGSGDQQARGDIQPPKLKRITSKDDDGKEGSQQQKDDEYVLPMPNLTKMVPADKNWNLEYTEDDVKNLGLDDLLLRASELNAENFTKALGQNTVSRNGGSKGGETSDIVLAFPNPRRGQEEVVAAATVPGDASKAPTAKKTKLDFFKRYVKDDKSAKGVEEEPAKEVPEAPQKRPGIKVKTVQNINEEFKDSMGGRVKGFEGREVIPETTLAAKPVYAISDEHADKVGGGKEIYISDTTVKGSSSASTSSLLSCRATKLAKDQSKVGEEGEGDSRPFIMTIIQNKDGSAGVGSERLPAILRAPKVFARGKTTESTNLLSQAGERRADGKETEAPGENVTLLMTEPRTSRPFEVVNVDEGVNYVVHYRNGSVTKKKDGTAVGKIVKQPDAGMQVACRKKNIPFILNNSKKFLRMAAAAAATAKKSTSAAASEDTSRRVPPLPPPPAPRPVSRAVKCPEGSVTTERVVAPSTTTSTEARAGAKEPSRTTKPSTSTESTPATSKDNEQPTRSDEPATTEEPEADPSAPKPQVMSLSAFTTILKDILPDKWILSLDKKYGLQIIKTHLDELLNPSIMISVVVGRTGKVTVNVRGRQLEKSHDLFSNLCDMANSDDKISINYILAILNKLRLFNVCFGCDDLSLKKYWCEDGFIEYYTEFQQTYRSHICELLVRLGKKRCYPCYRMHESLKKRKRREQLVKKVGESDAPTAAAASARVEAATSKQPDAEQPAVVPSRGVKRNLDEFLEESFITMKQKIMDEIEKNKEDRGNEKIPQTQDEVLSFMGLTRKDSLDVNLRKSKRERKGLKKCESMFGVSNVNKEELYFLEKYWTDINVLFSTSLLIGAYSRTSTGRLREKCRMFHKLLTKWRGIIRDNPIWIGGHMSVADNLVEDEDPLNGDSAMEKFDRMDVPALRAYIINCVREVNKIKSRLRTKNTYFKVLYNTFVKPRMKKVRQASELVDKDTAEAAGDGKDGAAREEDKAESSSSCSSTSSSSSTPKPSHSATPTDAESCDEKDENSCGANPAASDGE